MPVAPKPVQTDGAPVLHGTPAPYGRACTNCARAKCRCIYRTEEGGRCDRCFRLNKECIPSVSARRRSNKRQASSRTAQLEEKLEDLVTMLRNQNALKPASTHQPASHNAGAGIPTPTNNSLSDGSPHGNNDIPDRPSPIGVPPLREGSRHPFADAVLQEACCDRRLEGAPMSSLIPYPDTPTSRLEAEDSLRLFRTKYLPTFPCVHLPPGLTAEQLREEKPFLWFSIMIITCQSSPRQLAMGDTMKRIVAEKLVMEHEKNMDILIGLIVFLGWSQYHRKEKPYVSVFAHLAISLIYSLSLHKPPGDQSIMACFKPYHHSKLNAVRERTMEDRRAVLSCFQITSQVSYTVTKLESVSWTPYMDQCLDELSKSPESPLDVILATQVRTQLIVEQISRAPWQFYEPQAGASGPPAAFITALHAQRERIKDELPASMEHREFIDLQLFYTKLATLESGLPRYQASSNNPDFHRYDILSKCLEATKEWLDRFFSIRTEDYPALAFTFWCQLLHCLISLYRLTTLDEPAWDRSTVRETVDLIATCDKISVEFGAVAAKRALVAGLQPGQGAAEEDMFWKSVRMVHTMRARWITELAMLDKTPAAAAAADTTTADAETPAGVVNGFVDNVTTGPMAVPMMMPDELWPTDNMWLTEIFNASWE